MISQDPARAGETHADVQWSLRFGREEDLPGILDLVTAAFGTWPEVESNVPPIDHLRWKVSSHPDVLRYCTVAEARGRIIGVQLLFLPRIKVKERELWAIHGVDLCVHSDFQNQGVMTAMRPFGFTKYGPTFDLRYGMVAFNPLRKMTRREGSERIENRSEIFTCQLRFAGRPAKLLRALQARALHLRHARQSPRTGWTLRNVTHLDEQLDAFWQEASRPFDFISVRDSRHLNWRYDPRAGAFTIALAEQDGHILGYVVYRTSKGIGYIADLLVLPKRLDVASALVYDALAALRRAGVAAVDCALPRHHPYRDVLRRHGFLHKRRTLDYTFGAFKAPAEDLSFLRDPRAAVHLTFGDSDLV